MNGSGGILVSEISQKQRQILYATTDTCNLKKVKIIEPESRMVVAGREQGKEGT